jgi:1-pyrroline-4-hydroxy-2-carboxylate deaminase
MSVDVDATADVVSNLIRDGVSGLIINGTAGENTSLTRTEKMEVLEAAVSVAKGRVPVLCGVAEYTTAFAIETARETARLGADDAMVMPGMVYSAKPHETVHHLRQVASSTDLPIMVYNNPLVYKTDVTSGVPNDRFPIYEAVPLAVPGEMAAFIRERGAVGINRFQLKVGNNPFDDVARTRASAEAGDANTIIVADSNGGWSLASAKLAMHGLAGLAVILSSPAAQRSTVFWHIEIRPCP